MAFLRRVNNNILISNYILFTKDILCIGDFFMKVFMLGIKGSGMAALATLLDSYGIDVSGCDVRDYIFTQDLLDERGIKYYDSIVDDNYDFVIKGNSYKCNHKFNCPIYNYVDVLRYLSCKYKSIAVCGSHGKTTTTGMLSKILESKCSYLIGDGSGGGNIEDEYFVFEACEYKRNFLNYKPSIILINNIELDHIDYYDSIEDYVKAFEEFKSNARKVVIVNGDDTYLHKFKGCLKYGFNDYNDLIVCDYIQTSEGASFSLCYKGKRYTDIFLKLYGKHQVYNAVGAIFVSLILGENIKDIINKLSKYEFNKRRFNIEEIKDSVIIDDYGHQPSQIRATLSSINIMYPDKYKICIFKPDRYSRLFYFKDEFIDVLSLFDESYICDFPSCSNNDLSFPFSSLSLVGNNIKFFDEINYSSFKNIKNTVFLVTSSKCVNNIKEGIKEMIKDG